LHEAGRKQRKQSSSADTWFAFINSSIICPHTHRGAGGFWGVFFWWWALNFEL